MGVRPASLEFRLAREAGVRWIEPFHISPRYAGEEARLMEEAMAAFAGTPIGFSSPSRTMRVDGTT